MSTDVSPDPRAPVRVWQDPAEPAAPDGLRVPPDPEPEAAAAPVFDLQCLDGYYGKVRAVRDVKLQSQPTQIPAFIGRSGCGKTTVLRCLNRINDLIPGPRIEGPIRYHGLDLY